jgi:leucyl aminopeptidase
MITAHLWSQSFWDCATEGYIIFVEEGLAKYWPEDAFSHIEKLYYPRLKELLVKHAFEGKLSQTLVLTAEQNKTLMQIIFVGIGKTQSTHAKQVEQYRRAMGTAVGIMKKLSIKTAGCTVPSTTSEKFTNSDTLQNLVTIAHMANYEFIHFKTDKQKQKNDEYSLYFATHDIPNNQIAMKTGNIIGAAINQARHWADLPGNIMTPTALSLEAEKIAKKHTLTYTIFGREKALELGMGGFCAVDAGSDQDGKFVVLEYKAQSPSAPTIALCGKGVTFDTGGISLKPASSMEGMKFDMSGAAAVLAVIDVIAQLKPDINVIALAPMVENMPSGKATRQDDVITAMNGKTIEIQNTDAEGRLILADTLCYAEKFYNPSVIIDIATLTGACAYALGHFYTALLTQNDELREKLQKSGIKTGDKVWPLPFDDDFKKANKSEVADVQNSGARSYLAGTIIGACFLSLFVEKTPWAHLDIAGTAHEVPDINYLNRGSTGAGVRLLVDYILNYK